MSERTNGIVASSEADPILIQLIDELADRLQAGEPVDWDSVAREHPGRVEQVRKLLPAIAAIAELGSVTGGRPSRPHPAEAGFAVPLGELGDYRILREIGRGGMGVVYEATQISLGRRVALKVLPFAPALDARQLQRFQNEARAAAHLNHANIVPVYAVGCERGVHYYAMQFIEGQSLSVLIDELRQIEGRACEEAARQGDDAFVLASELASGQFAPAVTATMPGQQTELEGPGPTHAACEIPAPSTESSPTSSTRSSTRTGAYVRTVARMGLQAADALEHAHQQGVIHRDIKPSNLLVDARGNLWVADFGLARFQSEAGLTMTGDLLGTLRYMSPEQALGKSRLADHRTDIYSLGATLYELLALEPVYAGRDRQEILRRIAFEEPRLLRRINTSIPIDLETIVLKAMSKDPAGRYGTAQELADDLDRFLKREPIRARRNTAWEKSVKWAQRRPAIAALLATVILTTIVGFMGISWQWLQAERARRVVTATNVALETSLYFNRIALAEREMVQENLRRVDQLLDDCPSGLRNWEWNYLKRARAGYRPIVSKEPGPIFHLAYSPDGRLLATSHALGSVAIWDAASGKLLHTFRGHKDTVRSVVFIHDGHQVVSLGLDATMKIWDVDTGTLIHEIKLPGEAWGVALSPDGRLIAASCCGSPRADNTAVSIWEAATGKWIRSIPNPDGVGGVAFSPDGVLLATAHESGMVSIWEAATGRLRHSLPGHVDRANQVAFSPDGLILASTSGNLWTEKHGDVRLWDVDSGKFIRSLVGHTRVVFGACFSPDGTRLATTSFDHKVKLWDVGTGQEALTLHGHNNVASVAVFSPDGTKLATCSEDSTVRIWDASTLVEPPARELSTFTGHTDDVRAVHFSSDGASIASAGDDQSVRLWDAATGRPFHVLQGHIAAAWGLAFSPDGKRLASGDLKGMVRIWDMVSGGPNNVIELGVEVFFLEYSRDGHFLATGSKEADIEIRDGLTGTLLRSLPPQEDWGTGCLALCPDARLVISGSRDGAVRIRDTSSGELIRTLIEHIGRVSAVAWSLDDRYVAAACVDGAVRIWDAKTWTEHAPIPAHSGRALGLAFSPDSRRLASCGSDQSIKVCDPATGNELMALRGHLDEVNSVSFSPDGKRLASASGDDTIKIWDVMPGPEKGR